MAAGIGPREVQPSMGFSSGNWDLAKKIKTILLNNLARGHLNPEPTSISYYPHGNVLLSDFCEQIITDFDCMVAALKEKGAPDKATFKAESLWPWMAENLAEEEGFDVDLYEYLAETYLEDNGTKTEGTGLSRPPDAKSNVRETALTEQVAVLTERLQQAENENTALKKRTFRHENQLLELVRKVQERYWGDNFDPNDPDTYSKQYDIIEWLMKTSRCESQKEAEMIARMARPPGLRPATKRPPFLRTGK